jgi:hypothetical protein
MREEAQQVLMEQVQVSMVPMEYLVEDMDSVW